MPKNGIPDRPYRLSHLPNAAGVGYKPKYFNALRDGPHPVEWIEIHAENYMGDGGRPLAQLRALAQDFPISIHGVGLSIGAEDGLDRIHLARLRKLCDLVKPAAFSEHLAWSTHDGDFLNDLLPLPYTKTTLDRVVRHISQVQDTLGRQMLLENPSSYLLFTESTFSETDFISEVVHQTMCGLLLDVNNVFISCTNLGIEPSTYVDDFPLGHVREIHVGGHEQDTDDHGAPLLIDNHGTPVAEPVWALLKQVLKRIGPRPILVEWDNNLPDWTTLRSEAVRAAKVLTQ